MSQSQKSIKEERLQAKALLDDAKAIYSKGDDATPDEVAQADENTKTAQGIIDKIKQSSLGDIATRAGAAEAALSALYRPDRPVMGGDGGSNGVGYAPAHQVHTEQWALKSLGQSLVDSDGYKAFQPTVQGAQFGMEFPNLFTIAGHTKATFTTSGSTLTQYDRPPGIILLEQQRLTVADLLASGTTTSNTIRYVKEDTYTNAATTVAEEGTKPEATFDTSEADAPVRKVAVTAKVTDEIWSDFPTMQSYIDGRLRFMVGEREEAQLLNGDGNAPNLRGILQTSGIQTQAQGSDTPLDAMHKGITKVRSVGFFEPDGIVIHPTDYQIIRLEKDGAQQYYGGGPFMGPYSNPNYPQLVGPWGLRPVVTTAITVGTALVGAFRLGAMIFRRAGVTVQMTNSDQDDFVKNRITIRAEQRLALAVFRPKAFCTITGITASA